MGSNNECGMAANFTGHAWCAGESIRKQKFCDLIGKSLFEIAERGIHATDCMERSVGIAALSALSQQHLGSSSVRDRGFLAQGWTNGDKLIHNYPKFPDWLTKKISSPF